MNKPCKTVIVYGNNGPEEREPVEDYYLAPAPSAVRALVEAAREALLVCEHHDPRHGMTTQLRAALADPALHAWLEGSEGS